MKFAIAGLCLSTFAALGGCSSDRYDCELRAGESVEVHSAYWIDTVTCEVVGYPEFQGVNGIVGRIRRGPNRVDVIENATSGTFNNNCIGRSVEFSTAIYEAPRDFTGVTEIQYLVIYPNGEMEAFSASVRVRPR